jgi:hypothetical protein
LAREWEEYFSICPSEGQLWNPGAEVIIWEKHQMNLVEWPGDGCFVAQTALFLGEFL